eukprot:2172554-Lingulodinium_polyedra.AAC.1
MERNSPLRKTPVMSELLNCQCSRPRLDANNKNTTVDARPAVRASRRNPKRSGSVKPGTTTRNFRFARNE